MATLDNAVWLGSDGFAESGTTTLSEGGNSTIVTGTFSNDAWNADAGGTGVSEFGAAFVNSAITADYQFSTPVENLAFTINHVNGSEPTYDDYWTIYAYDEDGVLIPAADVIAGLGNVQDELITTNSDGSVSINSAGGTANDITVNLPGSVSQLTMTYENGPEGTQSGGSGLSDFTFDIPPAPDFIVEGTNAGELINAGYGGDPHGDRVDNNDNLAGNNDDSIRAEGGNDTIGAGSGNDSIDAGTGDDVVYAETGNDTVLGGDGNDSVLGESGDDSLLGDAGNDTLMGGDGNDVIKGGADDDSLRGEAGNDTLQGGEGNDYAHGGEGDDSMQGGAGNDEMHGWYGNDTMSGDDGNDYLDADLGEDLVMGGAGNDTIKGGYSTESDTLQGGSGNDDIDGQGGDDLIEGGTGDDSLSGSQGDDTFALEDSFGNDTIIGGETDEFGAGDVLDLSGTTTGVTVDLSDANAETGTISNGTATAGFTEIENIVLGAGDDTLVLADGGGDDTVQGFGQPTDNGDGTFSAHDQLDVSAMTDAGGDPITVTDVTVSDDGTGNAVLTFPNGESLTLMGVAPGDVSSQAALQAMGIPNGLDYVVEGTGGADTIDAAYTGDPDGDRVDNLDSATGGNDDSIEAGAGNDVIHAGLGNDTVRADKGDDSVDGGDGDDEIYGFEGSDTVDGGAGNDSLVGGLGKDLVSGGDGDDTIVLGQGDTATGGDGDDTFYLADYGEAGAGTINIVGGEGDETDGDTLHLSSGVTQSDITYTNLDDDAAGLSGFFSMADGTVVNFNEIENIICFTPGAKILTGHGERAIETLSLGDMVVTRDHGLRPIRWIGKRTVSGKGDFAPVSVKPSVVDGGRVPLLVSPQHRILFTGYRAELLFGESEVLVPAKHLVDGKDVTVQECDEVTYIHIMFDRHEVIYAEGIATESFHAGDIGLNAVENAAREELFAIFPELRSAGGQHRETARTCLRRHEAKLLMESFKAEE
ncbi:MAG: Hint domain-containing protein [Roseovarius sp.]|nr:Hint domain-containing protein [Roseovarius sp.]